MTPETYHQIRQDMIWELLAPEKVKAIVRELDLARVQKTIKQVHLLMIDIRAELGRGELTQEQFDYELDRIRNLSDDLLTTLNDVGTLTVEQMGLIQNALYYKPINKPNQTNSNKNEPKQAGSNQTNSNGGNDNAVQNK